jgi:hypothetical protein
VLRTELGAGEGVLELLFIDHVLVLGPHTVAPITRAHGFSPLRSRGVRASDQRSNQAQEFLLLWPAASPDEKGADLDIGDLTT